MDQQWKIETRNVQAGWQPKKGEPRVLPIYQSTTFRYDTAEEVADLFDLKASGHFYSRVSNPTVAGFEEKLASLDGGVAALGTAAGHTAVMLSVLNICTAGDHFIASAALYGGTISMFTYTLKKLGIEVTLVAPEISSEELRGQIRANTKCIFGETLSNPSLNVLDIEKFATAAHENGIPLIVDNTLATPYLCRPIDFGADIVVYSATKYLDGHAVSVGGAIVDSGKFDWSCGRFPELTEPDPSYHGVVYSEQFGAQAYIVKARVQWIRDSGAYMSPMNAFLINLGMETLHLRMECHSTNALALAEFLEKHDKVEWVNYPGLPASPEHDRLRKYLKKGSGVLTFGVKGGMKAGEKVLNSLKLAAVVVHVADVRTSVLHPASTTHRQLSVEQQREAGVSPEMVRVSVGVEHVDDIIADFAQALEQL
jgi:O-acetylhomoserine (thiol)-lyase